jgi:hypothetical protein
VEPITETVKGRLTTDVHRLGDNKMYYDKCRQLIKNHVPKEYLGTVWSNRHIQACVDPRANEAGIWALINAFAALADGYFATSHGSLLGQDGYFADHAVDLVKAMRAYLNFDVGRFDCGTLDRLILDLAQMAGVELED